MKKITFSKNTNKKINKFKQTVSDAFNALWSTVKVAGGGTGGAYLIVNGIDQNNVVFLALGSVIAAFAIIVLVSIAHIAAKSSRA